MNGYMWVGLVIIMHYLWGKFSFDLGYRLGYVRAIDKCVKEIESVLGKDSVQVRVNGQENKTL